METLKELISQIQEPWVLFLINLVLEGCRILYAPSVYNALQEYDKEAKKEGHYDQFVTIIISVLFTSVFYIVSVFASDTTTSVLLSILMGIQMVYTIYLATKVIQLIVHFAQRKRAIDKLIEKEKEGK